MSALLLSHTSIYLVARAVRMCSGTLDKMDSVPGRLGPKDKKIITKKILKIGQIHHPLNPTHESVLEHLVYTFEIEFSRACLLELDRHRLASPSVESSRLALDRILDETNTDYDLEKHLTLTGDDDVDTANFMQLRDIIKWLDKPKEVRKPNDIIKYALPEAFRTRLMFTINARSLRNFLCLRTSNRALWEIRETAFEMAAVIPEEHKFLFADRTHEK